MTVQNGEASFDFEIPEDCIAVVDFGFPQVIRGTMPAGLVTEETRKHKDGTFSKTFAATAGHRLQPRTKVTVKDKAKSFGYEGVELALGGPKGFYGTGFMDIGNGLEMRAVIRKRLETGESAPSGQPMDLKAFCGVE